MTYIWPVKGFRRVTSGFGPRIHPVTGVESVHNGIDIACPEGTPVVAPASGTVSAVWVDERYGGGLSVKLDCGGMVFGFCHLSSATAYAGKPVEAGEELARSGGRPGAPGSGRSTGPHLHFTARVVKGGRGVPTNPELLKYGG